MMPPAVLQRRERDAELAQHRLAEQGEQQDDHSGDEHRLDRDGAALGPRVMLGVMEASSTAVSIGPITAKKVVNAVRAVSSMGLAEVQGLADGYHLSRSARREPGRAKEVAQNASIGLRCLKIRQGKRAELGSGSIL